MDEQIYDHIYAQEDWHWWFRGRRAVIRALLERAELAPNPRILDAGCGTGRNLVELAALGQADGVDASQQAVEYCHKRGLERVQQGTLDSIPFEDGSLDLMLLADVLEHIDDAEEALRELLRVAKPSGRLVLTVPAYQWMWSRHDISHHHHRRYTRPSLREQVRGAGWEPAFDTYFNSLLLPPIALVRGLSRLLRSSSHDHDHNDMDSTPSALNGALSLPMRAEAGLIRRGVWLPAGVSIGMVCRPAEPAPSLPLAAAGAR